MYNNMNEKNLCMDWDDAVETDGQEYVLLDEGDYNFTVTGFERSRYPGSAKIPACNKAALTLNVVTEDGKQANVKCDLMLYRPMEFKIAAFFRSIGQKKHGERMVMNWNAVLGAKGRARFKPRTYINRDGDERQTNDVDRFYDYDEKFFPADEQYPVVADQEELPFE